MKKTTAAKCRRAISVMALPLLLAALIPSCSDGSSGGSGNHEQQKSTPENGPDGTDGAPYTDVT